MSCTARNTQGVTLIRVGDGERLVASVRLDEPSDDVPVIEEEEGEQASGDAGEHQSTTAGDDTTGA